MGPYIGDYAVFTITTQKHQQIEIPNKIRFFILMYVYMYTHVNSMVRVVTIGNREIKIKQTRQEKEQK